MSREPTYVSLILKQCTEGHIERRHLLVEQKLEAKQSSPKSIDWGVLRKPSVISVFLLVALWNFSVSSDWPTHYLQQEGFWRDIIGGIRDINLHLQLRFYQGLTKLRPIPFQPDHVSLAYIDDDTHWTTLYGDQPTSREYLARLITNASQTTTKATAIGLDVELLSPRNFPEGSDAASRFSDNQKLLAAIQFATRQGVPVILGSVYSVTRDGHRIDLPNIFTVRDLLASTDLDCSRVRCPGFGYLNLPDDKREIPIATDIPPVDKTSPPDLNSFAVAIAKAFRGPVEASKDPLLSASGHARRTAIYGTFLPRDRAENQPEERYPRIIVPNLATGESTAEQACASRIVLIGGHWHDRQGYGDWVDQHLSPAGYISGLGLHANYVESLLQHQYTHEVSVWIGVFLDLLLGLVIYMCFEAATTRWRKIVVLIAVFLAPILLALLFLDVWNIYLDFLLPIELYFLHILYELIEKHFSLNRNESA